MGGIPKPLDSMGSPRVDPWDPGPRGPGSLGIPGGVPWGPLGKDLWPLETMGSPWEPMGTHGVHGDPPSYPAMGPPGLKSPIACPY